MTNAPIGQSKWTIGPEGAVGSTGYSEPIKESSILVVIFPGFPDLPRPTRTPAVKVNKYRNMVSVWPTDDSAVKLWSRRQLDIVRMSAIRQLKTRYRGTLLGVLWSLANPLLMTGLYSSIFGTAFASYYGGSVSRYVLAVFVAVVVVTFFSQATAEALASVVSNGGLLNKIAVDPETFPVASMAANTFQQVITTFPLILIMSAVITHDPLRVVLVPIVFVALVAMVTGFGLALATLYVFFRDLSYLWAILSFIFWMTSPVFYPAALAPERVRFWFEVNPVGLAIAALREVTLGHGGLDITLILKFGVVSIVFLVAGHALFRFQRDQFMDLL